MYGATVTLDSGAKRFFRSDGCERRKTMYAVSDRAVFAMELFNQGAERYTKKVAKLFYCSNSNIEAI